MKTQDKTQTKTVIFSLGQVHNSKEGLQLATNLTMVLIPAGEKIPATTCAKLCSRYMCSIMYKNIQLHNETVSYEDIDIYI